MLRPEEVVEVLRILLKRHRRLGREAEELAMAMLCDLDAEAVADDVEEALLLLDVEEAEARSGRKRGRYVDPTEAAWELLDAALEPFLERMRAHIRLGLKEAAVLTCQGIVLGLYRCQNEDTDHVLGLAGSDFPADSAENAAMILVRDSAARQRRGWRLPDSFLTQIPEWKDLIRRARQRGA